MQTHRYREYIDGLQMGEGLDGMDEKGKVVKKFKL